MAAQAPARTFSQKLRQELKQQNVGVRTLARRLDSERVDSVRRQLNKYLLEGVQPTDASRHAIERALGLEKDALAADEEAEDESNVEADLVSALTRLVRKAMADALAAEATA